MNYEKRCKELVVAIKQLQETNPSDEGIQNWANDVLYGTKETEDERIRKALIRFFGAFPYERLENSGVSAKEALAWLEKQGETSPVLSNSLNIGKREIRGNEGKISPKWTEEDEAHLHSITTHLEQWIERHPNTCGADIQWENLAWLKSIKQRIVQ